MHMAKAFTYISVHLTSRSWLNGIPAIGYESFYNIDHHILQQQLYFTINHELIA